MSKNKFVTKTMKAVNAGIKSIMKRMEADDLTPSTSLKEDIYQLKDDAITYCKQGIVGASPLTNDQKTAALAKLVAIEDALDAAKEGIKRAEFLAAQAMEGHSYIFNQEAKHWFNAVSDTLSTTLKDIERSEK